MECADQIYPPCYFPAAKDDILPAPVETITVKRAPVAQEVSVTKPGLRAFIMAAALGLLWFILCRQLSNEWSANEQYSYGWFVPFFAAYLFWLRWEEKGELEIRNSKGENEASAAAPQSHLLLSTLAFLLLAALLPIRLFEVGNPDWRPLDWLHASVVVTLTLLLVWKIGGRPWLKHFAFPICFILVAVPWVSPIEAPIVQGLMRVVARIASETLALFGIPAQLEGSVIRISGGVVGVNEACSGVRSLQTSLMIGLLFGELKRLSMPRRLLLLVLASAIAFIANCARAFFLVWIAAAHGVEAIGKWHDTAGYAILIAVFLGTIAIASWLAGRTKPIERTQPVTSLNSSFLLPKAYLLLPLLWLLVIEVTVETWYRLHERNLVTTATWSVHWPESASGFRTLPINDDVRSTLRFDRGREAQWPLAVSAPNEPTAKMQALCSMFFFRWEPGTTSILRARAHRPDICLPNTGWRVTHDLGVRRFNVADGFEIPFRHFSFARPVAESREVTANAFFCEREDRVPRTKTGRFDANAETTPTDWMRADRVRVVREGLRNQGQQVLEVVLMTPQPIDTSAAEAEFAKLLPQVVNVQPTP
ncbi:MAG: exosortase/archaeosortase family protein [Chthoniobacterales bacterium]